MADPPNPIDDSSYRPFRLQFSLRTLFLAATVLPVMCVLLPTGIPQLFALITGPLSAGVFLVRRKRQPAELVLMVSSSTSGLAWATVAVFAAVAHILVEPDLVFSGRNPFLVVAGITSLGVVVGFISGLAGLSVREGVLAWQRCFRGNSREDDGRGSTRENMHD